MNEPRRDQWGRYLVDGKPCTRVTTVADGLDSKANLGPWTAGTALLGVIRQRSLMGRLASLTGKFADPWYDSEGSKDAFKKLIADACKAGGSADKADLGTARHDAIEQVNLGVPFEPIEESLQRDVEAYRAAIAAAGIEIDPAYVETVVVLEQFDPPIAGTADVLRAVHPRFGPCVLDLKTAVSLGFAWPSISIQLAAYAGADFIYRYGTRPEDDRREEMPEGLNREVALVAHLPAGSGACSLHVVDIVAGWEALQLAVGVRAWRKTNDLARPLTQF